MADLMKANVFGMTSSRLRSTVQETFLALDGIRVFNSPEYAVFPGFCDVHVHFREPGFSYKETIKSGSLAAARGGYTAGGTMPNLNPVPDTPEALREQTDIIDRDACIHVYPLGAITVGEGGEQLSDMAGMAAPANPFADDGRGVQSEDRMRQAMLTAKSLGKVIVAHCEDNSLLHRGYIHDGPYARVHGHRGICSESEWLPIARDLQLARETGCPYHVCHISTKESVALIRAAKRLGVDVTCETAPHYLILDENDLREDGKFKMNPPLRSTEDKLALLEGVLDGTIDMIATDHAPHSAEEKSRGLERSAFGIVGIETAFATMYTHFVKTGKMTMEQLLRLLVDNPRQRFHIPLGNDFSVWALDEEYTVDPAEFRSLGRATPFDGARLFGRCVLTVCDGKVAWKA